MSDFVEHGGYIDRLAAWFGIGDLDFRLTKMDRRRLIYASIAPGLVLLGDFILLLLQEFEDIPYFDTRVNTNFNDLYTGFWWHFYSLLPGAENFLLPVAVALLILFAVSPVNRAQGSGALVATVVLLNVAIAVGAYNLVVIGFHSFGNQSLDVVRNWLLVQTGQIARDAGILAAGYAFLAYRGLSPRRLPRPRRARVRRPDDQPRES